jgi:hypothetical protein
MLHPGCSVDPNRGTRGVVPATRLGRAAGLSVFSQARMSDLVSCLEEGGGRASSLLLHCPRGWGSRERCLVRTEKWCAEDCHGCSSQVESLELGGCSGGICRKTAEATLPLPSVLPVRPLHGLVCASRGNRLKLTWKPKSMGENIKSFKEVNT